LASKDDDDDVAAWTTQAGGLEQITNEAKILFPVTCPKTLRRTVEKTFFVVEIDLTLDCMHAR
jgi:hypothetical protein